MPNIRILDRMISKDDLNPAWFLQKKILICLDDLEEAALSSDLIKNIYTKFSNHNQIGIITILQTCTYNPSKAKHFVSIKRSCNSIILFQNNNDKRFIISLSATLFPYEKSFLLKCLNIVSQKTRNSYICICTDPNNILCTKYPVSTFILDKDKRIFFKSKCSLPE